jgi:hypothetical protein
MEEEKKKPDAWIIESKVGIWLTTKPEIAAKHINKAGTIVTEYFSKKEPE